MMKIKKIWKVWKSFLIRFATIAIVTMLVSISQIGNVLPYVYAKSLRTDSIVINDNGIYVILLFGIMFLILGVVDFIRFRNKSKRIELLVCNWFAGLLVFVFMFIGLATGLFTFTSYTGTFIAGLTSSQFMYWIGVVIMMIILES